MANGNAFQVGLAHEQLAYATYVKEYDSGTFDAFDSFAYHYPVFQETLELHGCTPKQPLTS